MNGASIEQEIHNSAILVVDDNPANVELLREMLLHQGYATVQGETDPRRVPELCRQQSFDILLLDVRMPLLNGFQLIELLKPQFADDYVPILVLTAQTDQSTRRQALEVGATDFLTKPFVTWELLQRVRNMLHNRVLYKAVRQQNRDLEQRVAERTHKLTQALEAARRADRAKLDFLAVMSHELRTPLNTIIGFAEYLTGHRADNALSPETQEYLQLIEGSGKHLLGQVNRILEFTHGATGTLTLDESEVELRRLVEDALAGAQAKAQARQVSLELAPGPPLRLRGDGSRLVHVISSLLDNAIKFHHEGGRVAVAVTAGESGEIMLRVADDGPGMSPEIKARVFDPFSQGEVSLGRRHDGIGLGLPLVARFIELHGGHVTIDSAPDQGTVAYVFLPAERRLEG